MSFIEDLFEFDKWGLSNIWDQIKDDPWRLLTGGGPLETEVSNAILGRDDEPLHNAFGGPMGSGWLGFGSGGVYDDYINEAKTPEEREKRIDVKQSAVKGHDIAEVVAGIIGLFYGLPALAGAMGGGAAAGGGAGAGAGGTGAAASGTAAGSTAGVGANATLGNTAGLLSGGSFPGAVSIPTTSSVGLGNTAGVLGVGGVSGGAGAAAGGAAPAAGGSSGNFFSNYWDSIDWSDPNTYIDMYQQFGNAGGGGGDPYAPGGQIDENARREAERKHMEEVMKAVFRLADEDRKRKENKENEDPLVALLS